MTRHQKQRVYELVEKGPEAAGFTCGVWNSAMIVELIQKEFNVTSHPRYVSSILHQLGLSYQKARFVSDRVEEADYQRARRIWDCFTWPSLL